MPVGAVADAGNAAAHKHYHLRHIHAAIDRSALSEAGKARAVRLFTLAGHEPVEGDAEHFGDRPERGSLRDSVPGLFRR